jgi:hypothetical protein
VQPFLESSRAFAQELTSFYDFINPTAAAMWNLRWQVKGYVEEQPDVTIKELHGRFVTGSGIGSANLRRHCIQRPWEQQVNELSVLGLTGAIGLFEGWLQALELGTDAERDYMQFPSQAIRGKFGAADVINRYRNQISPALETTFGPTLRSNSRYFGSRVDDMMLLYRSFKEVRNSCVHAGRLPTQLALDAYALASPVAHGLGRSRSLLQLPAPQPGVPLALTLIHVQALCALLLNIVTTLDADLSTASAAEGPFIERWRKTHSRTTVAADPQRRSRRLAFMCQKAGMPTPSSTTGLYTLLRTHYLIL